VNDRLTQLSYFILYRPYNYCWAIIMKPSITQRFLANNWPWKIVFWGFPLCIGLYFVMQSDSNRTGYIMSIVVGALIGVIVSYFFLRTLWHIRARINGAPFYKGDIVLILTGKYRGQVVSIYEVWKDRNQVRVDIGEQAKIDAKDVFSFIEVCRETQAKPISGLERP